MSRNCAPSLIDAKRFYVDDRGAARGLFVTAKVTAATLRDDDSHFRSRHSYGNHLRPGKTSDEDSSPSPHALSTSPVLADQWGRSFSLAAPWNNFLLHSQLPLDVVLGNMLDHGVSRHRRRSRPLLLEADASGALN